ncbi:hypothetical protein AB9M93_14900 [Peribacillus frigoritolerans]|uniref:hypothetical protein n=1 Tax=Peribacillus frigoritolerans TaxID=450367 RepID=UPI003511316A
MTLSIAWIRKINDCEELIIASDSRLNGGGAVWDQCPKIVLFPRSDSSISFAGNTLYTYPFLVQVSNAIQSYNRSQDRAMDLHDLRGHIISIINDISNKITITVPGLTKTEELKDTEFILGGYSWIRKKFSFWKIYYDLHLKKFVYNTPQYLGNFGEIIFAGDQAKAGKTALINLLKSRNNNNLINEVISGFNMEPFEILVDLLKQSKLEDTIGGPPQIVKVYQHMNCKPIGVYWPNKNEGKPTLMGRTLFKNEDSDFWFIDPSTLKTEKRT